MSFRTAFLTLSHQWLADEPPLSAQYKATT